MVERCRRDDGTFLGYNGLVMPMNVHCIHTNKDQLLDIISCCEYYCS